MVQAGDAEASSATVANVAAWVIATDDNRDLPFVIIDKVGAKVFVFSADGKLRGSAPALLGAALGDTASPGVGDRELWSIPPQERTTPAGRFLASFGPAYGGKRVLWVDYRDAISLHPVVTNNPKEHRLQRLRSPTPADNRITFGCINVPAAFYRTVVAPAFVGTKGIIYILPDSEPLEKALPGFREQPQMASLGIPGAEPDLQPPPLEASASGEAMSTSPSGEAVNASAAGEAMSTSPSGEPVNAIAAGAPMNATVSEAPVNASASGEAMSTSPAGEQMDASAAEERAIATNRTRIK